MKNDYQYVDPDYIYTNPETGLLRNKENLNDYKLLLTFESFKVAEHLEELKRNPMKIKDSNSLLAIHKYLFQDIYDWAGEKRKVEISKGGKQFFPTNYFDRAFLYIDSLIDDYRKTDSSDMKTIAAKLATILDTVNYLHPFREGNGRAQREFLKMLALEKGYILNLNPPDNADVYERYMKGTIESDTEKLADLLFELISEPD
jgi:cell filamentation protein